MNLLILGFALGVCSLLLSSQLLTVYGLTFLVVISLILISLLIFLSNSIRHLKSIFVFISAICLGCSWASLSVHRQQQKTLTADFAGQNLILEGSIISVPEQMRYGYRFEFVANKIYSIHSNTSSFHVPMKIRLIWANNWESLRVGDEWQLQVKLQPPRAPLNPGNFDNEAWFFQQGIAATGYVIKSSNNRLIDSRWYQRPIDRMRQDIANDIINNLRNSDTLKNYTGFLTALSVGIRDHITPQQWQILRNTGTNHLMAIAGLHIGFVATITYFLSLYLFRYCSQLFLRFPNPQLAATISLITAVTYSAMAGFSLPTQRAIVMLTVFLLTILTRRYLPPWRAWLVALLIILWLEPLAPLSSSFWLSFITVALLIYGMSGRLQLAGKYRHWMKMQWIIMIGLIPLMLLFFQQVSFAGLLANAIAIPWVGFLILPLCLLSCFSILWFPSSFSAILFKIVACTFIPLWYILNKLGNIAWLQWHTTIISDWILVSIFIAVLLILSPPGFPAKWLSIIFFCPIFLYHPRPIATHNLQLTLLDVKRGIIVIIQTQHHLLIYTTQTLAPANRIFSPYLISQGLNKIDLILDKTKNNLNHLEWQWDGINFIWNKKSLWINHQKSQILILPNIILLKKFLGVKPSTIITLYNKDLFDQLTSQLLQQITPHFLLLSGGWQNRNNDFLESCNSLNIKCYDTAESGALEISLSANGELIPPKSYRFIDQHFWNRIE